MKENKYLVVISFDAMSARDYEIIKELPNFKMIMEEGAYAKNVYSIYPSLTYPAHTSIVTGKYPCNHGVINNTILDPGSASPDWYWYRKYISCDTLYDVAKKNGMSTAALLWPVTGGADIDYNIPEIFPNRWWQNQVMVSLLNGSIGYTIKLNNRFGNIRRGIEQPYLDDFITMSTAYTIKEKKPNLVLVHLTDLDTQRHSHGYSSKEALDAINRHDRRLGAIIKSIKDAGIYNETTIVALGDHSTLDENKIICLNVLLKDKGFISVDKKNKIVDWKAYVKSCDGSAYVYIKNRNDDDIKHRVKKVILDFINKSNCIEKIYTGDEAKSMGADGKCAFMLEANMGYYFLEDYNGEVIRDIDKSRVGIDKKMTLSAHGYSPEKNNYTTMFIGCGRKIKKGVVIPMMNIVDEAPTMAKILGISLRNCDGRVIEEMLNYDIIKMGDVYDKF